MIGFYAQTYTSAGKLDSFIIDVVVSQLNHAFLSSKGVGKLYIVCLVCVTFALD